LLLRFRETGNGGHLEFFEKNQPCLVIWNIFLLEHFLLGCAVAKILKRRKW
jgi:hypothetical protein